MSTPSSTEPGSPGLRYRRQIRLSPLQQPPHPLPPKTPRPDVNVRAAHNQNDRPRPEPDPLTLNGCSVLLFWMIVLLGLGCYVWPSRKSTVPATIQIRQPLDMQTIGILRDMESYQKIIERSTVPGIENIAKNATATFLQAKNLLTTVSEVKTEIWKIASATAEPQEITDCAIWSDVFQNIRVVLPRVKQCQSNASSVETAVLGLVNLIFETQRGVKNEMSEMLDDDGFNFVRGFFQGFFGARRFESQRYASLEEQSAILQEVQIKTEECLSALMQAMQTIVRYVQPLDQNAGIIERVIEAQRLSTLGRDWVDCHVKSLMPLPPIVALYDELR